MGITVAAFDAAGVTLQAELGPNLNHRDTAFGGSVAALAILEGWTHVHLRLRAAGIETHTVIQDSSVRYDAPIFDVFSACCGDISDDAWARFTRTLSKRGKARIRVRATLESQGERVGHFEGAYVAMAARRS